MIGLIPGFLPEGNLLVQTSSRQHSMTCKAMAVCKHDPSPLSLIGLKNSLSIKIQLIGYF